MIGSLPESLVIDGADRPIRSDYRNILQIFEAFSDPDLREHEKGIVVTYLFFEDFSCGEDVLEAIESGFNIQEAHKQMQWFIQAGMPDGVNLEKPVYSWQQDEQMIFSSVNKVAGKEVRGLDYLHWWTFLGFFREIGEGTFSLIAGIRHKKNNSKKLEKHEQEFYNKNKELVDIKKPMTKEEREAEEAYQAKIKRVLRI